MYQALYRKYRPASFDDVISQSHITTTLKNQIMSGKTAHAYLFTGSRGTGKTTCARIFAKALNCEDPVNGSPCCKCSVCTDADNFALSDIIEIDAASNGSVNDARELREAAEYAPERCRYKIYIIDEVHMLSKEAFNALLKVIEEPPPYIKFIMATTELHKVLPTILSRCQRFDFMRIKTDDIAARLADIAVKENITLEPDAAQLIAKAADGGMRDALSILDRCIAFSENITQDVVSEATGIAGRDHLFALAEAAADKNPAKALNIVAGLYDRSKDMQRLCEELASQFRNIMIAIAAPEQTGSILCLPSELDTIKHIAAKMTLEEVMADIDALSSCAERMTRSLSKRIDLEMCLIKICSPRTAVTAQAAPAADRSEIERLYAKISELEQRLGSAAETRKPSPPSRTRTTAAEQSAEMAAASSSGSEIKYIGKWLDIIDRLKETCPSVAPALSGTYGYECGGKLLINTRDKLIAVLIRSDENSAKILTAVNQVTGLTLSKKILVGYREALDRSLAGGAEQKAPEKPSPEEAQKALLEKAESGGIPVETI